MSITTGIFENFATSIALSSAWSKRKADLDTERLQPYADLLLDNVVWPDILAKKDQIFAALKAKCETARAAHELFVPIWSFNHVFELPKGYWWVGGSAHKYALDSGEADAVKSQHIADNGWHQWMDVRQEEWDDDGEPVQATVLSREGISRIVKKTDFLHQLARHFGGNYRVVCSSLASEFTFPNGERGVRSKITLNLCYFPSGLPEHHQKAQNEQMVKLACRGRRTLKEGESITFWRGNPLKLSTLVDISAPPPVVPAPAPAPAPAHADPRHLEIKVPRCPYKEPCYCHCDEHYSTDDDY